MKKLLLIVGIAMLLPACSSNVSSETKSDEAQNDFFYKYKTAEFEIEVPDEWEVINAFGSEYPEELRIAFRNNIKEGDYIANLTVFRERNDKNWLNADLSQEYLNKHASTLIGYKLLAQEEITLNLLGNESASILNTFEGKNTGSDPVITYMQSYLAAGDTAWIITASYYAATEDEFIIERMKSMIQSFTLN